MRVLRLVSLALLFAPAWAVNGVFWRTITETGTTTIEGAVTLYGKGRGALDLAGSFGGGTVKIEKALPDGTWVDISDGGYTSEVLGYTFDFGGCTPVRIKMENATSPSMTWSITPEFYKQPTPQSPDCATVPPE